ncbi:MAG TPA: acyltransferase [Jatrophihabitans sp.]|nr:acyltransferase [Jatrophihabitans sp.]
MKAAARRLLQVCGQDLRWLPREFWVNVLAAAAVTPRVVRAAMYRAAGIRTATLNISAGCTVTGRGPVTIGRGTFVNLGCTLDALAPITIGQDCAIAPEVLICTSTHALAADGSFGPAVGRPVTIGDRCWIGARATILPGVRVGDGVVIAAGAVVTRDCQPGGRYRGVPAERYEPASPA